MNAIRESVRHDIDVAFRAEQRVRRLEEKGEEEDDDQQEEDSTPEEDPVPAISRAHFEASVYWGISI